MPAVFSKVDPFLDQVLARHEADPHALVQILRDAQEREGWLPPSAITYLAARLGMPRARIEGVAGFYSFLHGQPAGRYRVLFSDNITDRMQGSEHLLDHFCRKLWLEQGKVSEDGLVSVGLTSCTGMSDQGPALLVNGWAVAQLTEQRVDAVVDLIRARVPLRDWRELLCGSAGSSRVCDGSGLVIPTTS